jgi:hypothetical protein
MKSEALGNKKWRLMPELAGDDCAPDGRRKNLIKERRAAAQATALDELGNQFS